MKIVFVGSVKFSQRCLEEVVKAKGEVIGVLTQAREHAAFNSDYVDLAPTASKFGIPLHRIKNINDESAVNLITGLKPDIMFIFGFSQLVSPKVLGIPPRGCIGSHPALLPKNRGRHPLIWTLVNGLSESGLTFFYLDSGADSGDILWQKSFPVTLEDDASTLYAKVEDLAEQAIREFVPLLNEQRAPRVPQDNSKANYWPKRSEADGEIDWNQNTLGVYNLIRALTRPYPGAHTFFNGERVKVWRGEPHMKVSSDEERKRAGEILDIGTNSVTVRTGNGALRILEWESTPGVKFEVGRCFGRKV